MPHIKTAITVPEDVLADVDRAAKARGESRSKYVTRILREATRARGEAEVTRRLNALFGQDSDGDPGIAELDALGTDWSDERW